MTIPPPTDPAQPSAAPAEPAEPSPTSAAAATPGSAAGPVPDPADVGGQPDGPKVAAPTPASADASPDGLPGPKSAAGTPVGAADAPGNPAGPRATPPTPVGAAALVAATPAAAGPWVAPGTGGGGPRAHTAAVGGKGQPPPPRAGHPHPGPWPAAAPRPPSQIERRWPGPAGDARPLVLGGVATAAVVAASAVPLDRPGLGWTLAALAGAGALLVAATARRAATAPPTPSAAPPPPAGPAAAAPNPPAGPAAAAPNPPAGPAAAAPNPPTTASGPPAATIVRPGVTGAPGRAARLVWAVATIALIAVGSVRAAGWLFVLCLLAAAVTATLAVAGGRTPIGMLVSAVLPPAAAVRALPWAVRGLARSRPDGPAVGRSLASVAVSVGLLLLFGLLFSSADAIFADLVADLLPDISPSGVIGWVFRFLLVGAGLLGGAYLLTRPPDLAGLHPAPARPVRRLDWALPLALLDALFAAFVLVQLTVLFGGSGHVLRTAGLSYAEYARSGFWQLLAVSALTLLVIAGAARWAPRGTRADRLLIRLLLGALTLLSLVVVASALYRMNVYAEAYGATRLRIVVATAELWLGLLFVLVGVATIRLRARWLPGLVVGTAVLALLGLAAVDPDRLIAERNVDRYLETGRLDVGYLAGLSADAVPALDRLPEPQRSCALREIAARLPDDGVRTANLGRAQARRLLGPEPEEASFHDCPGLRRW